MFQERKANDNSKIKITTWDIHFIRKYIESIEVFIQDFFPNILVLKESKFGAHLSYKISLIN